MRKHYLLGITVLGLLLLSLISVNAITTSEREISFGTVDESEIDEYQDILDSNYKDREIGRINKEVIDGSIKVKDPTKNKDAYTLAANSGYIELNTSRGQTTRHFYNTSTDEYTFSSDYLVIEPGVIEGTNWVTIDEFPNRVVVRMTDGTVHKLASQAEIDGFFASSDNSTIWAVGLETFTGMMGFYLNIQDTVKGHGQYLYWPR
ncbi:MAG: hypothetical protein ACTSP4_09980, partial [Candidatus Hodarchaeales archaeon]